MFSPGSGCERSDTANGDGPFASNGAGSPQRAAMCSRTVALFFSSSSLRIGCLSETSPSPAEAERHGSVMRQGSMSSRSATQASAASTPSSKKNSPLTTSSRKPVCAVALTPSCGAYARALPRTWPVSSSTRR